jgi:phospholipid transport system substrate-binding protein
MEGTLIRMRRRFAILFLTATLAVSLATAALAANDPTADVKSLVDRTLTVLHDKQLSLDTKRREFRDMVRRKFDVDGMARDSMGEHWNDLSAAAQSKFSDAFNSIVADTYLGKIRDYDREQVNIISEELTGGGHAAVSGSMVGGNEGAVDLKFKLRKIGDDWKINDYSFNNDGAMGKYRSDFKEAYEKSGFDGLMDRMKTLQDELDAKLTR